MSLAKTKKRPPAPGDFLSGDRTLHPHSSAEEISAWLAGSIARATAVDPDKIDRDTPLWELGLDSINALTITGDLAELLDTELEQSLLWDYPTINKLSEFLADEQLAPEIEAIPNDPESELRRKRYIRYGLEQEDLDDLDDVHRMWRCQGILPGSVLQTVQRSDDGPALVWCCPDVDRIKQLADNLPGRPVYAFFSGYTRFGHSNRKVKALARAAVSDFMEQYPPGRVLVGGYCHGAKVSVEIARMLEARGYRVPFISLIEWYGPSPLFWLGYNYLSPPKRRHYLGRIRSRLREFLRLDRNQNNEHPDEAATPPTPPGKDAHMSPREKDAWFMMERWRYRPEPLSLPAMVVLARESYFQVPGFRRGGWRGFFRKGATFISSPGDHHSVMEGSRSAAIAKAIRRFDRKYR